MSKKTQRRKSNKGNTSALFAASLAVSIVSLGWYSRHQPVIADQDLKVLVIDGQVYPVGDEAGVVTKMPGGEVVLWTREPDGEPLPARKVKVDMPKTRQDFDRLEAQLYPDDYLDDCSGFRKMMGGKCKKGGKRG